MILVLTGPTGSGKSKLAVSLAKRLDAAIINADAFQVYQELSIATAKPSPAMRMEVPHFLFDFVPLTDSYNVAEYQADARSVLACCQEKGQNVIIAGGTGLYIKAALFDYEFTPKKEVDLSRFDGLSEEDLHAELAKLDPISAASIHPHNRLRVRRALEICLSNDEPKSAIEAKQSHQPIYPVLFFGLNKERQALYEDVEKRVDEMFEEGLLEETLPLIERYGRDVRAFCAIGVKELFPYIDGQCSLEEAKDAIKRNTRNYIKRQMTWFNHQFDLTWVEDEKDLLGHL